MDMMNIDEQFILSMAGNGMQEVVLPLDSDESQGHDFKPGSDDHKVPVLPMGNLVLFPSMIVPVVIQTQRSIRLIQDALASDKMVVAVLQRDGDKPDDEVAPEDLYGFGCLSRVIKMLRFPDDTMRVLVQGLVRCKIVHYTQTDPYLAAHYAVLNDEKDDSIEVEALTRNANQYFQDVISMSPTLPEELRIALFNVEDAGKLSDLIASNLNMPLATRQRLLEEYRPRRRLEELTTLLNREREVLAVGSEIQSKVSETFSQNQRRAFLHEQLNAIRKELGEEDQQTMDILEIEDKIAKADMPAEALAAARKEKDRLRSIPPASPEYGVVRNYLDWLLEMPWTAATEDKLDIAAARASLDADHYGLQEIKDRILEFLSVLKLKSDMKGPILCFVGPPGVGKTSLGQSIARAMGRKFIRMSLGGIHDEAEIRGHRRTYIGALPGRIIQGLRKVGTRNPVFMLDEVDKVGADFRGDPSAALLEVLDPEQNFSFSDNYLEVPFDLSQVLFICTANRIDTIPPPLKDRMEILNLSGYTLQEKVGIARKYLVPKQRKAHGLKARDLKFRKDGIEAVAENYTRESGVRNLDREIANICRKLARKVAEGNRRGVSIGAGNVASYLGRRKIRPEASEKTDLPGVVTGLAWTPVGGDILFIEAGAMPGKGQLTMTGSLGDVMKESAQAALSFVRTKAATLKIDSDFISKTDIHLHVPAGSIPKDGPSAGLAMAVAIASALTARPVPAKLAMTGEITLRGRVMAIGGVKEKVLAAARAGITTVILPKDNRPDIKDIPAEVRKRIEFKFVEKVESAFRIAFADGSAKGKGSR
jgi:ATP-dependent Lon protease